MTSDEQTLRGIIMGFQNAWNAADYKAFAAPFSQDAQFIHIYGHQLDGRGAIEEAHRLIFASIYKDSRIEFSVLNIQFLRPDVAIVLMESHVWFQAQGQPREFRTRPTLVASKEGGQWVIQLFQNTRVSALPELGKAR